MTYKDELLQKSSDHITMFIKDPLNIDYKSAKQLVEDIENLFENHDEVTQLRLEISTLKEKIKALILSLT